MSNQSPLSNESLAPSGPEPDAADHRLLRSLKSPIQFFAFWAAIALPFVHVAVLAHGLTGPDVILAFVALLAANLVALYVGHGYNQS